MIKDGLRKLFRILGYDLRKYVPGQMYMPFEFTEEGAFVKRLQDNNIDVVFDIGANNGTWASSLRSWGYVGKIISFEPQKAMFEELAIKAKVDERWDVCHCAIGNEDGEAEINVSKNTLSSSLRAMTAKHISAKGESIYTGKEKTVVKKIDSVLDRYVLDDSNVFLKIDTQGFEKNVLEGASKSLGRVKGVQLEMSFQELYEGEVQFFELQQYVKSLGFILCHLENGFCDEKTGELLQVDAMFISKTKP